MNGPRRLDPHDPAPADLFDHMEPDLPRDALGVELAAITAACKSGGDHACGISGDYRCSCATIVDRLRTLVVPNA